MRGTTAGSWPTWRKPRGRDGLRISVRMRDATIEGAARTAAALDEKIDRMSGEIYDISTWKCAPPEAPAGGAGGGPPGLYFC